MAALSSGGATRAADDEGHARRCPATGAAPLRVLTYNIRIGAGHARFGESPYTLRDDVALDLDAVAAAIDSVSPDVVALQEVLGEGQAKALAERLGMHWRYAAHAARGPGSWWGLAVLSTRPILSSGGAPISRGRGNTRALQSVAVDSIAAPIEIVNVHRDRDIDDGRSLAAMERFVERRPGPVIVAGDLNLQPPEWRQRRRLRDLVDTAVAAPGADARRARELGTWPGHDGERRGVRIDYVLVPPEAFDVVGAGVLDAAHRSASDHLGYYADVCPREAIGDHPSLTEERRS